MKEKRISKPANQEISNTKEYLLNDKKFSYHSISFQNFHKFPELFSSVMQDNVSTPFLMVKTLFKSEKALDLIQLILLDENNFPPTIDFLKTVKPVFILAVLSDYFVSEGNLLLNGIFALIQSMK